MSREAEERNAGGYAGGCACVPFLEDVVRLGLDEGSVQMVPMPWG